MRTRIWAGAVLAATSIVTATSYAPAADADPLREDTVAARAVAALTADDRHRRSSRTISHTVMGYRPTVVDGMLVNPDGACSSPIPLPSEFDTACKSHDLGYDLLRYAHLNGGDLGTWARTEIDAQLDRRLHDACDAGSGTAHSVRDGRYRRDRGRLELAAAGLRRPRRRTLDRYTVGGALAAAGVLLTAFVIRRIRTGGAA